jgi:hypothetical protein
MSRTLTLPITVAVPDSRTGRRLLSAQTKRPPSCDGGPFVWGREINARTGGDSVLRLRLNP